MNDERAALLEKFTTNRETVLQRSMEAGKEFIHVKTGCAEEVARVRLMFDT